MTIVKMAGSERQAVVLAGVLFFDQAEYFFLSSNVICTLTFMFTSVCA